MSVRVTFQVVWVSALVLFLLPLTRLSLSGKFLRTHTAALLVLELLGLFIIEKLLLLDVVLIDGLLLHGVLVKSVGFCLSVEILLSSSPSFAAALEES